MSKWWNISKVKNGVAEIYIYGEIGWEVTASGFVAELLQVEAEQINLHIHSPGGNVMDGWAIYQALLRHGAKIVTHIDGMAASMASIIALAGEEIVIAENGWVMIHNPASVSWGESDDFRRQADLLDRIKDQLVSAYVARTGKTDAEIRQLMDDETWWDADDAIAAGYADRKSEPIAAAASVDLSRFGRAPAAVQNEFQKQPSARVSAPGQPKNKEKKTMNDDLKKKIIALGASAEVSESTISAIVAKAEGFQAEAEKAQKAITDAEAKATAETQRINALIDLGDKYGLTVEAVAAIKDGTTLDAFKDTALDAVTKRAEAAAEAAKEQPTSQPVNIPKGAADGGQAETLETLRAQVKGMADGAERSAILAKIRKLRDGE